MGPRPPLLHPPLLPLMQTLRRRGEHLRVLKPQMVEVHEARGLPSRVHLRQGYTRDKFPGVPHCHRLRLFPPGFSRKQFRTENHIVCSMKLRETLGLGVK